MGQLAYIFSNLCYISFQQSYHRSTHHCSIGSILCA